MPEIANEPIIVLLSSSIKDEKAGQIMTKLQDIFNENSSQNEKCKLFSFVSSSTIFGSNTPRTAENALKYFNKSKPPQKKSNAGTSNVPLNNTDKCVILLTDYPGTKGELIELVNASADSSPILDGIVHFINRGDDKVKRCIFISLLKINN